MVKWSVRVPKASQSKKYQIKLQTTFDYDGEGHHQSLPQSVHIGKITPFTTMETYEQNTKLNMIGGDESTYYWSNEGASVGDAIGVDLGTSESVQGIRILMGANNTDQDYIHDGVIEVSQDGESWTKLLTVHNQSEILLQPDKQLNTRYVRLKTTKNQSKWVKVREIQVKTTKQVTIKQLQSLVGSYTTDGTIKEDADLLQLHLKAINHYVQKDKTSKAMKHMKGFKRLVQQFAKTDKITKKGLDTLISNIEDWIQAGR